MDCPACGYHFEQKPKEYRLHTDDIMGLDGQEMFVTDWHWRKHVSRSSGKEMLACTYYGGLSDPSVTEYFPILHEGYAGQKAIKSVYFIAKKSGVDLSLMVGKEGSDLIETLVFELNTSTSPLGIKYQMDGKFYRVTTRIWEHEK
jgi:hypothetical protein